MDRGGWRADDNHLNTQLTAVKCNKFCFCVCDLHVLYIDDVNITQVSTGIVNIKMKFHSICAEGKLRLLRQHWTDVCPNG